MTNVFLIAGIGYDAFDDVSLKPMKESFKKAGAQLTVVGDGKNPIKKEEISKELIKLAASDKPTTVFVHAHGRDEYKKIDIEIDGTWGLSSGELFDDINRIFGHKKVDVFMTCCHGGAVICQVDQLPKGSHLVALGKGKDPIIGVSTHNLMQDLSYGKLSAPDLLEHYLLNYLKKKLTPVMAISGTGVYDFDEILKSRMGKPFTSEEAAAVYNKLGNQVDKVRIDRVKDVISSTTDIYKMKAIDYGLALAISWSTSPLPMKVSTYEPYRNYCHTDGSSAHLPYSIYEMLPTQRTPFLNFEQLVKNNFTLPNNMASILKPQPLLELDEKSKEKSCPRAPRRNEFVTILRLTESN